MKHDVQIKTEQVITIDDLTNNSNVGFISLDNKKGYIVFTNKQRFEAISLENRNYSGCNLLYGAGGDSIKDAILEINNCNSTSRVKQLFCFDTRKELYAWLAE